MGEHDHQKLIWIIPEEKGGIYSAAMAVWPHVRKALEENQDEGTDWEIAEPYVGRLCEPELVTMAVEDIRKHKPTIIHIHHEYGLFRSRNPWLYLFPQLMRELREKIPNAKIIATAHTIRTGAESASPPWGYVLNWSVLPLLRNRWIDQTWNALDAVITQESEHYASVRESSCDRVVLIPRFIPEIEEVPNPSERDVSMPGTLLLFGYFAPEKGQDVAIRAFARMQAKARLVLAGGARRNTDQPYFDKCRRLVQALGITERVTILGYVPEYDLREAKGGYTKLDRHFQEADVVLLPTLESTDRVSLDQALARGAAILASDIPLHREINERVPGALSLYPAEDTLEASIQMDRLCGDVQERNALRSKAREYATRHHPKKIGEKIAEFYGSLNSSEHAKVSES